MMKPVFILISIASLSCGHCLLSAFTTNFGNGSSHFSLIQGFTAAEKMRSLISTNTYSYGRLFFSKILVFYFTFPGGLCLSITQLINKRERRRSYFIFAISLTILIQLAVIIKHFDEHYLVIVINSFGPLFFLLYLDWISRDAFLKALIFILIVLTVIQSSSITSSYATLLDKQTKEVVHFNTMIHSKYPHAVYIGSYLESPIRISDYALFMGNDSSGGAQNKELSEIYPDHVSFFTDSNDISGSCTYGLYHFNQKVWADDLLNQHPEIIFINSGYDFSDSPYVVKPIEESNYSKAYLLTGLNRTDS